MKCIFILLLQLAALAASFATPVAFCVRAGSFNIRCETSNDTGDKSWGNRKTDLVKFVNESGLDLVGFQEVKEAQKTYLSSNLSGYTFYAGTISGSSEYVSVAYKKDRFDRLGAGTFWLSDTPEKKSKFSDAQYYRICTWVLLRDKLTMGQVLFASTHLDLKDVRLKQMQVIIDFAKKYLDDGINVVLVGDMNEYENNSGMVAAAKVFDDAAIVAQSVSGPWRTYNGWTYISPEVEPKAEDVLNLPVSNRNPYSFNGSSHKRIDFIFVSKSATVDKYVVCDDTQSGKSMYHSDHYMIYSDLVLPVRRFVAKGRVKVEITASCPSVNRGRRFQLTSGAMIEDASNIDFILPDWVARASVEDGEIVVYTRPRPMFIYIR